MVLVWTSKVMPKTAVLVARLVPKMSIASKVLVDVVLPQHPCNVGALVVTKVRFVAAVLALICSKTKHTVVAAVWPVLPDRAAVVELVKRLSQKPATAKTMTAMVLSMMVCNVTVTQAPTIQRGRVFARKVSNSV